MTLAEIYDAVCNLVYGDITSSPVPVAEVSFIQMLILQQHHGVQQDYNFWFNRIRTTLSIVTGTDTYDLPDDYKEMIAIDPEDDYGLGSYELLGDEIIFKDDPTKDATAVMDLWQYLPTPAVWDGTHTDSASQQCHMGVIYAVTGFIMLKRDEKTAASAFMQLSSKFLESVYADDYGRRQAPGAVF